MLGRAGNSCSDPRKPEQSSGSCETLPKTPIDCPAPSTPNPVNTTTGNKHFNFSDIRIESLSSLRFSRHYNSSPIYYYPNVFGTSGLNRNPIGQYWYHNYYYGLTILTSEVKLTRNTGQTFSYHPPASGNLWQPDADVNYRLEEVKNPTTGVRTGWKVTTPDDTVETYSPIGDLLTITDRSGLSQTLIYSHCTILSNPPDPTCPVITPNPDAPFGGLLLSITDNFGKSLNFSYNNLGQLTKVTAPSNTSTSTHLFNYTYDSNGNLKTVYYPDDTPDDLTNNPKQTYHYGGDVGEAGNVSATPDIGVTYTHALTGITDENNVRYATYQYDASGKAVSTEHAGAVEKYGLTYLPDDTTTTGIIDPVTHITDPLNSVRSTHFTRILDVLRPTGTDQPGGSGCSASSSATTYDANGNVASRTDFNGHKACYAYDLARNLETTRVEGLASVADCTAVLADGAALPANARKTSTQWHPDWRLPVSVAEPNRRATFVYNGQVDPATGLTANCGSVGLVDGKPIAVLCQRSEQATGDGAGRNGFAATLGGTARVWRYTYNATGQVLTEDGPRTDATDTVNYGYYTDTTASHTLGDLSTVSRTVTVAPNAKALVTTYDSYTPSGQPTQITAANGVVTQLSYYPRGWLKALATKDRNGANGEATQYTYTPTGLLATVTLPDTSTLTYSYDDAHRLTDITDKLGNKVHYVLDAAGNRKEEEYRDPAGTLKRNISRVYDASGRLQTVTGAEQ